MSNFVLAVPAAEPLKALEHFQKQFEFKTDCWDTHNALQQNNPGFVLLDVRSKEMFDKGHVPGATNLLHGKIVKSKLSQWPMNTIFVTYCAGPHCNGAAKAAVQLAKLGRPVKIMVGGITGWIDEGFKLAESNS